MTGTAVRFELVAKFFVMLASRPQNIDARLEFGRASVDLVLESWRDVIQLARRLRNIYRVAKRAQSVRQLDRGLLGFAL